MNEPRVRLVLRALPDETPPIIRLRGALKVLLRRFGLKCEEIELLGDAEPANLAALDEVFTRLGDQK